MELSSFVAGPPITHPFHFFGRERELKRLFSLWKRLPLQNAAIIGPRRSGKTSLLYYLKSVTTTHPTQLRLDQRADWLPEPEHYRWIFADLQDLRLGTQEGILRYLLSCLDLPTPEFCRLDYFMSVVSECLDVPTIILLDEIGVALQRYSELDDAFWEGLRSLATNLVRGNLAFVLAAHQPPDQLAQHSNLGSPFFNIFGYSATLGPLREPEARELIFSSPLPFSADDTNWILDQSGCWPILLQVLCRERLVSLEEGETGDAWREEGLRQMRPFQHLLGAGSATAQATLAKKTPSKHDLRRLHQILSTRFDKEDLRTLCFYLDIDFDNLKGESKGGKVRELLVHLAHRRRIAELVEMSRQLRPDISWDSPSI